MELIEVTGGPLSSSLSSFSLGGVDAVSLNEEIFRKFECRLECSFHEATKQLKERQEINFKSLRREERNQWYLLPGAEGGFVVCETCSYTNIT